MRYTLLTMRADIIIGSKVHVYSLEYFYFMPDKNLFMELCGNDELREYGFAMAVDVSLIEKHLIQRELDYSLYKLWVTTFISIKEFEVIDSYTMYVTYTYKEVTRRIVMQKSNDVYPYLYYLLWGT